MTKKSSIKATITRYLDKHSTPYEIIKHGVVRDTGTVDGNVITCTSLGKPIVVRNKSALDGNNFILTIIPANHALDMEKLNKILNCEVQTVPAYDYVAFIKDWAPGMFSPIAEEYDLRAIIDDQVCGQSHIHFKTEENNEFIKLSFENFRKLHRTSIFGHEFSTLITENKPAKEPSIQETESMDKDLQTSTDNENTSSIKQRIERITELPPMPEMAERIIHLNANPYARAEDLSELIELDPSLASQIIRYAKSPFFGYRGSINSIQEAIARVLGYDMVMNIALGLAAAAPFKNPKEGPLGLSAFWQHAIYSAALTQMIAKSLPKNIRPQIGLAYLSGLLHNFGFLLLGHLFRNEFNDLNKAIANEPEKPVIDHETELHKVTHTEIGAWLMHAWNMPTEIITSIREHHNEDYSDSHHVYSNLVLIADRLLKSQNIGDASTTELPDSLLQKFNLDTEQLGKCLEKVLENKLELDAIAATLAA